MQEYYQMLGLYRFGHGSDAWKAFNASLQTVLLQTQVRTGSPERGLGSWDPREDHYGPQWGRVGQTALGALMLEVYYRYPPVEAPTEATDGKRAPGGE